MNIRATLLILLLAVLTVFAEEDCGIPDYLGECTESSECYEMYMGTTGCLNGVCMCEGDLICGCDILGPAPELHGELDPNTR